MHGFGSCHNKISSNFFFKFCCLKTLKSVSFNSSFAQTENSSKTDFSVHIISAFIQSALWKCISNVFSLCSIETIVSPLDSVDSSVEGLILV